MEPPSDAVPGVVIADASPARRLRLCAELAGTGEVRVDAEAEDGPATVSAVARLVESAESPGGRGPRPPPVVLLRMPLVGGLAAIERLMAVRPVAIVVLTSDGTAAMEAFAAGAADVARFDADVSDLVARIRIASRIRLISHPRGRLPVRTPSSTHAGADSVRVVAIGASTGGPPALARVLGAFPERFPAAVVVVQHMAARFLDDLADWLAARCPLPVTVGASGQRLRPAGVTLAPGGANLLVHRGSRVICVPPEEGQHHVPGIDATFLSVASAVGAGAVGVLLTGMGRDGALGLRGLRQRGAYTIVQDEQTCAVYGMPAAARLLDAADVELALDQIGPAVVDTVSARTGVRDEGSVA